MHEIEIRLPGSGFKASKAWWSVLGPTKKNTPSFLEAGTQNFQRQLIYWSWAEVEGCTVLTFRGGKKASLLPQRKLRKWKSMHMFFVPPQRWTLPTQAPVTFTLYTAENEIKAELWSISFFPPFWDKIHSMSSFASIHCWIQAAHVEHSDPLHLPLL